MIGKWHLGHNDGFHPTYRGFQSFLGLPYSGDMGCLDNTPQGCKPSYDRSKGQPACPALCPRDADWAVARTQLWEDASELSAQGAIAIPLYDSVGRNCSGRPCGEAIVQQPFDPMTLNARYTARATELITNFSRTGAAPFFLYMAYAHTHTPLAYSQRFSNASTRPGFYRVFGNTLAEVGGPQYVDNILTKALNHSNPPFSFSNMHFGMISVCPDILYPPHPDSRSTGGPFRGADNGRPGRDWPGREHTCLSHRRQW